MTITVCICTKDRPAQLKKCLNSIINGSKLPNQIIIINEGAALNKNFIKKELNKIVKIFDHPSSNLSEGRNLAISKVTTDIVGFTDDDCIVHSNWIKECLKTFVNNKNIYATFGRVRPYEPSKHKVETCPCTINVDKTTVISKPCYHATKIGFGNNMAFDTNLFKMVGGFKTWLSAGSIGLSAEDAEFALRIIVKKYKILHNPNMTVFHNKWLAQSGSRKQHLSYSCGEIACYSYFLIQGFSFSRPILKKRVGESALKLYHLIRGFIFLKWKRELFVEFKYTTLEIIYIVRGFLIGALYSLLDPIKV